MKRRIAFLIVFSMVLAMFIPIVPVVLVSAANPKSSNEPEFKHSPASAFNGISIDSKTGRLIPSAYYKVKTFEWGKEPTNYLYVSPNGNDNNPGTWEQPLKDLNSAVLKATPGTAVRLLPGTYSNTNIYVSYKHGTKDAPIWVGGVPGMEHPVLTANSPITFNGSSYIILHDMEITGKDLPLAGTTQDSMPHLVHVTDGGDIALDYVDEYGNALPEAGGSHNMIMRNLYVHYAWNSAFKVSGVNHSYIFDCEIADDAPTGRNSGNIDHVGSHNMTIAYNYLHNLTGTGISFKGGSSNSIVHNNLVVDASVGTQMGQSTGIEFFRPAIYMPAVVSEENRTKWYGNMMEADGIRAYSNIYVNVAAPFTMLTSRNNYFVNNTIFSDEQREAQMRLFRIGINNDDPAMANGGVPHNNTVANNIFFSTATGWQVTMGSANTMLDTFTIKSNMFRTRPSGDAGVEVFCTSSVSIYGNPMFVDIDNLKFALEEGSPAIGIGANFSFIKEDFYGNPYRENRSIGAVEVPFNVGDILGSVLYSDITAYINGHAIPASIINGRTLIVVEDLAKYGFDVKWNNSARTLSVTLNKNKEFAPLTVVKENFPTGAVKGKYFYTDIETYLSGELVESFAIDGVTLIDFDSLGEYGAFKWDGQKREIHLTLK